jgi:ADP-dependent NAD(P)H-hydrate dehydratase / NAD(P)H-hydrate epimerase
MIDVFFNNDILNSEKKIIEDLKIPSVILMENAGFNSAEIISECFNSEKCTEVTVLCGKGNNAGDGFVVSRHLEGLGIPVNVILLYPESDLKGDALVNFGILKNLENDNLRISDDKNILVDLMNGKHLIVDAVFGIGFSGKLEKRLEDLFSNINKLQEKYIVSIDTVSGLDTYLNKNNCLNADLTISMGVLKFDTLFYEGRELSGEINLAKIGIPDNCFTNYNSKKIFLVEKEDAVKGFTQRDINSNKYSNGKLYVLAGSEGFSGAAYLCSQAAIRTGSGAVILGLPKGLNSVMESKTTEVITQPLEKDFYLTNDSIDLINKKFEWSNAVLLGPGLGRESDTLSLIRNLVKNNDRNFIIDADGIFAFKGYTDYLKKKDRRIILTPHFGEFSNLLGITTEELKKDFYNYAKNFAAEHNVVLVLKNSPTIVTDGEYFYINSTGSENLATIGSGDILSGIIASLYSQNSDALQSAVSGVYLHGYCGDRLFDETGDSGTIASDLIELINISKSEMAKDIE